MLLINCFIFINSGFLYSIALYSSFSKEVIFIICRSGMLICNLNFVIMKINQINSDRHRIRPDFSEVRVPNPSFFRFPD